MISGNIEQEDNAKLFVKTEQEDPVYRWQYLADFSGASGIQGPQGERGPQGVQGEQGIQGVQGAQGDTGNGILSIEKTATSGLVDTYTITFTNGQTTTYQITNGENGSVVDVQVDGTRVVDNGIANIIGLTEMKQELEDMYNLLPKASGTGETITLDGTVAGKMLVDLKGNTSQDTNIITYTCLGTESGDYYFVYNSTNYQFTMPTISANDVLAFNTDTLKLYLGTTEITTTTDNTGTLITMNDTPSPDYPQDIHVVSGDNTIDICGKNLFEYQPCAAVCHSQNRRL